MECLSLTLFSSVWPNVEGLQVGDSGGSFAHCRLVHRLSGRSSDGFQGFPPKRVSALGLQGTGPLLVVEHC